MKMIKVAFVVSALALLGGCVAVPVDSGYYGGAPAVYAPAPVYFGPTIGIGLYGSRGHGHRRGHH